MADFTLFTFEWSKNILHLNTYSIFHTLNSKTRNKESRINKVYLIYVFCVVLSFLPGEVSHGEREKWALRERPVGRESPPALLCKTSCSFRLCFLPSCSGWLACVHHQDEPKIVYLLATVNPLCQFQCFLPFFHFLEFNSWHSFQFGNGIYKDFPVSSLVAFSQFPLHAVTFCR